MPKATYLYMNYSCMWLRLELTTYMKKIKPKARTDLSMNNYCVED
jgi:hypothetical protein